MLQLLTKKRKKEPLNIGALVVAAILTAIIFYIKHKYYSKKMVQPSYEEVINDE